MSWSFRVTQLGDLAREAERARVDFASALWLATRDAGRELQAAQRADVVRSGIRRAAAMSKTWRMVMRPVRVRDLTPGQTPKAFVFNRSLVFWSYLSRAGVARPQRAKALLIPVGRARAIRLRIGEPRTRLRIEVERRFGPLVPIVTRGGEHVLAIVSATKTGRRKVEPMFVLRRSAPIRDLLNPGTIYRRTLAGLAPRWGALVEAQFAALQGGAVAAQTVSNQDFRGAIRQSSDRDALTVAGAFGGALGGGSAP